MASPRTPLRFDGGLGAVTAQQSVLGHLRKGILSGRLPSGTRLVQAEIAAELGVSTTPVREALRDLAGQGLVQLDTHRGAVVRLFDEADMRDVFELRMLVEPYAVRQRVTARMAEPDLATLRQLQQTMAATEDPALWLELNAAFHSVFIGGSASPRLRDLVERLQDGTSVYVAMTVQQSAEWMSEGNEAHFEIVSACERGDAEAAAEATRSHIEATLSSVIRARPEADTAQD